MTRKEMEQLRYLQAEIEAVEASMKHPRSSIVTAFYKDYRYNPKGTPRSIAGFDCGEEEYEKLTKKLKRKQAKLRKLVKEADAFIEVQENAEIRTILRMYYVNGASQEEIGEALKYDHSVISRKLKNFWQIQVAQKTQEIEL